MEPYNRIVSFVHANNYGIAAGNGTQDQDGERSEPRNVCETSWNPSKASIEYLQTEMAVSP